MKNFFSLIALLFVTVQISAQDVPEIQRPLITKVAATWCPPCGGWGWDFFADINADNQNKATLIKAHHSNSQLASPLSEDIADNFNAPYQPYFYFNTQDMEVSSGNADDKRTEFQNMVNQASQMSPVANTGMEPYLEANNIDLVVPTKTRFFQEATGEFYLGVYIVEDDVVNFQQGQGSNAVHKKILRGAVTSGSFGELLMNGTVAAGTEFLESYSISLDPSWEVQNLEVITIIWEKDGDQYVPVNTNWTNDIPALTAVKDIVLETVQLDVVPTVVNAYSTLFINADKTMNNAQINLIDLNGKKVSTVFNGTIIEGETTITLERSAIITKGLYYVVLQAEDKVLTKPIIIE